MPITNVVQRDRCVQVDSIRTPVDRLSECLVYLFQLRLLVVQARALLQRLVHGHGRSGKVALNSLRCAQLKSPSDRVQPGLLFAPRRLPCPDRFSSRTPSPPWPVASNSSLRSSFRTRSATCWGAVEP